MNAFDILALGFTSISCFLVGYFTGSKSGIKEIQQKAQEAIKEIKKSTIEVGPIMRPTSEKVNQWENKNQSDEDEEFKKSFLKSYPDMKRVLEDHERKKRQTIT